MTNPRPLLEPAALHPDGPPEAAWESEIEASKAISLKRIADALEPLTLAIQRVSDCERNGYFDVSVAS